MNFEINSILKELELGAISAAQNVATTMLKEASKDATEFVSMAVPSTTRYLQLLIDRQIDSDEFKRLMGGLLSIAKMTTLTEAGFGGIEVDKTRNAVLKSVTDIALGAASKFL